MCKFASLIFTEARKKLGKELQGKKARTHELCHKQARRQAEQWGKLPPPIPEVTLAIFRLINLFMCKPKNCVSANQRNWFKKTIPLNF